MHWKNWPYWLKGGVIGAVISVIIGISLFTGLFGNSLGLFLLLAILNPVTFLLDDFLARNEIYISQTLTIISSGIFYFLIGAVIGWLVGKFKGGKK